VIIIKSNFNRNANKSNHPFQNPLLFVTEPRTSDNIKIIFTRNKKVEDVNSLLKL
jgi:hypothetical protein